MGYTVQPVTTAWQAWTPTFGGGSADPTYVARYTQIGKTVICYVRMTANGTSNSASKTITLPVAAAAASVQTGITTSVVNNGGLLTTQGGIFTATSSATATITRDMAGTAWTTSGGYKYDFFFVYEAL